VNILRTRYTPDETSTDPIVSDHSERLETVPAAGMANAAVPIAMPILPGSYTLKFFTGSTQLAVSEPVMVR
jgi:hypothetical protein